MGRHLQLLDTIGPFPQHLVLTVALDYPEEKQGSLGCPLVRDGQKYLFIEFEIQILQSQLAAKTSYQLTEVGSGFPSAVATPL